MIVGDDVPGRIENDTRPKRMLPLLARYLWQLVPEELPQPRIHKEGGLIRFYDLFGPDINDGRGSGLNDPFVRFVLPLQQIDIGPAKPRPGRHYKLSVVM